AREYTCPYKQYCTYNHFAPSPVDAPNPSPSPVIASSTFPRSYIAFDIISTITTTFGLTYITLKEGDAQSNIEEDHPLGTNLPIISPYGLG
ncbi:unnamed protein product, partial [Sphenostylis stenocarpa]